MASELEVGKIIAKTPATTGSSPLEVARLEVKDEGDVNLGVGMGPKQSFYLPHDSASFEGASIAAKKEDGSDTHEATSLVFSTCPNAGTNTERLTIASTGQVTVNELAGNTTNSTKLEVRSNADGSTSAIRTTNKDVTAGTNQAAGIDFGLSRNSGAFKPQAGQIKVGREADWSASDTNIDSYMAFSTYSNNALGERMRISSTGLATFSGGIAFAAPDPASTGTPAASSVLNVYEEGTWTPNVGGDATYTPSGDGGTGRYTRVGRLVTATFDLVINAIGTGSTYIVSGLPFATGDSIGAGGNINYYSSLAISPVLFAPTVAGSTVHIRSATSAASSPSNHGILGNGARIAGVVTYTV